LKSSTDFVRDFENSHKSVFLVARWLRAAGYMVKVNVPTLRADESQRFNHTDTCDIELIQGVEVKQRGIHFTCVNDYPYQSIFVDEKYKVDERIKQTKAYVVVNKLGTHAAIITTDTRPRWVEVTKPDKYQQRTCTWYACQKADARFFDVSRIGKGD
jgi:hypothetical protein